MRSLILAIASLAAAAQAADELAPRLVRTAWYWQARARSDKAEDAWKQVREAAPDNAEAPRRAGGFDARAGRLQQAREALARLERVSPGHPDVPVLRRQLELGTRFGAMLTEARKLVHADRVAEGAARYRTLFGEADPPGDLALEYYQTIGGLPGGWEQARDGLRRLVRRAPAEARFRVELGKLLTYREETRREGVELLAALARDPAVGRDATAAWRQALLWLAPSESDVPLFHAWAKLPPGRHRGGAPARARAQVGRAEGGLRGAGARRRAGRRARLSRSGGRSRREARPRGDRATAERAAGQGRLRGAGARRSGRGADALRGSR